MKLYRKFLVVFGLLVITVHLSFTMLYNFEGLSKNITLRWVVFKYMFPVFNQNNKVFAPDPPFSKQYLTAQFHTKNGTWQRVRNMQIPLLDRFYSNRLSSAGTELKIQDYVMLQLYNTHLLMDYYKQKMERDSLSTDSTIDSLMLKDEGYLLAIRYLSNCVSKNKLPYDSVKFACNFVYPEKFKDSRSAGINTSQLNIPFPTASLNVHE